MDDLTYRGLADIFLSRVVLQATSSETNGVAGVDGANVADLHVFLPPVYSQPFGMIQLPECRDENLLEFFMHVASRTTVAMDASST